MRVRQRGAEASKKMHSCERKYSEVDQAGSDRKNVAGFHRPHRAGADGFDQRKKAAANLAAAEVANDMPSDRQRLRARSRTMLKPTRFVARFGYDIFAQLIIDKYNM